ncbi:MAG: hypothetical protein FJ319_12080 [SAR202 cluster bacterium]|nr:hypothetical protein [SAR202 cluster bacterium]
MSRTHPGVDLTKNQLFLDDLWIEDTLRITRQWHKPEVFPEPVLRPEMPWEGTEVLMNGTVLKVDGRYLMYYLVERSVPVRALCVAESKDGLRWTRPTVGAVEFEGSKHNNIVLEHTQTPSVMYDPDDKEAPFKAIFHARRFMNGKGGMFGVVSRDGFRWEYLPGPLLGSIGDRKHLVGEKVNGKYVVLIKPGDTYDLYRARVAAMVESEDFRNWSWSRVLVRPDLLDPPDTEFYGMVAFKYSDLYVGLLERYNTYTDVVDIVLAWSRDFETWRRPVQRETFIGQEYPWNRLWSSPSSAAPVHAGSQLRIYFGGRSGAHNHSKSPSPVQYAAIGMAQITVDRFASLTAGFKQGRVVTTPMVWPGGDLMLNASTTRSLVGYPLEGGGDMLVEVWDAGNTPLPEFSGDNKAKFDGNAPCRITTDSAVVKWPGERSLNDLAGRTIRLVFNMKDSHLYSFRAGK